MKFRFWLEIMSAFLTMICIHSKALAQGMEPVLPLPEYNPSAEEASPVTSLHSGAYFTYYRPQQSWVDEDFSLFYLYLTADTTYQDFGLHLEGRFRDSPYADFYQSNVWFQESYLYYRQPMYVIKIGKEYSHLGRFWDGSLYGNVLAFDGLKLSPDTGFSFEGRVNDYKQTGMNYYLQYFVEDGLTNDAQDGAHSGATIYPTTYERTGRDTLTIAGGRRRNEIIGRIEPNIKFDNGGELIFGLSYMYLLADLTTLPPPPGAPPNIVPGRFNVHRYAYDITYTRGPFLIFVEYDHQHGQTVVDYPDVNDPSTKVSYWWSGVNYKVGKWTWYYNYSEAIYQPQNLHNVTQVPGFVYQMRKYVDFIFEYGYMYRMQTGGFYLNDNSLNFSFKASI